MIIYAKLQCSHVRHQYGIFGGKSQTSFLRNATRAGSKEGRLFSQARDSEAPSTKILLLKMAVKLRQGVDENADEWDTHRYPQVEVSKIQNPRFGHVSDTKVTPHDPICSGFLLF